MALEKHLGEVHYITQYFGWTKSCTVLLPQK